MYFEKQIFALDVAVIDPRKSCQLCNAEPKRIVRSIFPRHDEMARHCSEDDADNWSKNDNDPRYKLSHVDLSIQGAAFHFCDACIRCLKQNDVIQLLW